MRQFQPACPPPGDEKNPVGLNQQWHGNQGDDQGLVHHRLGLKAKEQDHGGDQPSHRQRFEMGHTLLQVVSAVAQPQTPCQHARAQGQHHIQDCGQDQGFPGHGDVRHAQQKCRNGRKRHHHDQVVHRHLHQGVIGVPFDQLAPNKDHGRARGHAQQNHAGNVFVGRLRIDPGRKQVFEKKHAQSGHGERLDEPVDHQGEHKALRLLAHVLHGVPVDLHHHRENHHPDAQRHHTVDVRQFQQGHSLKQAGHQQAQAHPGRNAQSHPNRQEALKYSHG